MTKDEKNLEDTENQAYYFLANLSGGKFYLKIYFQIYLKLLFYLKQILKYRFKQILTYI